MPTTVGLPKVRVPDEAPMFKVEAAPKALMVVAVVLKTEKDEESVKTEVVKVGEVEKTKYPAVPVSSVTEAATFAEEIEVVSCPPVVVVTSLLAVSPENVIVPDEVIPVAPLIAPVHDMVIDGVFRKLVNPPPPVFPISIALATALLSALFK